MNENKMDENKPPIDVYEDLIIEDKANDMFGFYAEGVNDTEGKWHELGVNSKGDYLWCWTTNHKISNFEQHKGWVVSGNEPKFINKKWLVMGFEPGIFYSYFGEKTIDRIKVINSKFFINNTIKVEAELVNINETFKDYDNSSFIVSNSQIDRLINEKNKAPIDLQIKFFFPIIELSDFLMQGYSRINSLTKFIKRTKFFLSISPVKHHLFKIQNKELISIDKFPIEHNNSLTIKKLIYSSRSNTIVDKNMLIFFKNLKTLYCGIVYIFPQKPSEKDINELRKHLSNIEVFFLSILEKL